MSDDPAEVPDPAPPLKERLAIRDRIREFPTTPGVYVMKDKKGVVVYVGKAGNLRARLRSYFARSGGDERFFVKLLDQVLGDIEIVSTRTAQEALLVENELIKTHQPRFNVKLKDDKNFLNLRLSAAHPFPRLEVTRQRKKDGARYFGPYASATAIRKTLRLVNRFFQLRTCRDREFQNRSRPCLEYQIKRCPAPCVLPVPKEAYAASVRQVSLFLDGRGDELMGELRTAMATAADALDFERAAQLRDQARAIEQSLERQDVVMKTLADLDVFGIGREGPYVAIHIQKVRRGRITAAHALKLGKQEAPDDVLMEEFLARFYGPEAEIPPEVLLSVALPDQALTEELLTDRRGAKVEVKVPERGERRRLVDGACKNAENALKLDQDKAERNREVLIELQKRLRLRRFPERIECFDISNIQGTNPVASMVVFLDGEPDTSEYRRFHIRSQDTPDDYLMMREALTRRFKRAVHAKAAETQLAEAAELDEGPDDASSGRAAGDWERPDLLMIDGGKGQLAVATDVLKGFGITDIDVIGLAKARVINDDPDLPVERSYERVFVPGVKDPIVLRQNSAPLYLLTRLRDEAHRFAITFHRETRGKARVSSSLEQIEGIGESRRTALLKHFGSLKSVKAATFEQLLDVKGISKGIADRIWAALHPSEPPSGPSDKESSV